MKRLVFIFMIGLLLANTNSYAAGDLTVDGKLGIGTTSPGAKLTTVGGGVLVNHNTNIPIFGGGNLLNVYADGDKGAGFARYGDNAWGFDFALGKSRATAIGSNDIVQSGDRISGIIWVADDGTDLVSAAAEIKTEIDGTPGSNDMPGRLILSTTSDGASNPTERIRIDSQGRVGIGDASPDGRLDIGGSYINSGQLQFTSESHSSFKKDIVEIREDSRILDKWLNVKIYKWKYKESHLMESLGLNEAITNLENSDDIDKEEKIEKIRDKAKKEAKIAHRGMLADEFNPQLMGKESTAISGDDVQNKMIEAIQALIKENKMMKAELCAQNNSYSWCW